MLSSKCVFVYASLNIAYVFKRFLKPSQVPGIDTEAFMRQQQIASNLHEQSILGYRGLVGENQFFFFSLSVSFKNVINDPYSIERIFTN